MRHLRLPCAALVGVALAAAGRVHGAPPAKGEHWVPTGDSKDLPPPPTVPPVPPGPEPSEAVEPALPPHPPPDAAPEPRALPQDPPAAEGSKSGAETEPADAPPAALAEPPKRKRKRSTLSTPTTPTTPVGLDPSQRIIVFEVNSPNAELKVREERHWRTLCTGPCETRGPVGTAYIVGGEGITNSRPFTLDPGAETFRFRAEVGSSARRGLGTAGIVVGGVIMGIGGILLITKMGSVGDGSTGSDDRDSRAIAGAVTLAGVPLVVAGIWLSVSSKTRLDLHADESPSGSRLQVGRGLELSPAGLHF